MDRGDWSAATRSGLVQAVHRSQPIRRSLIFFSFRGTGGIDGVRKPVWPCSNWGPTGEVKIAKEQPKGEKGSFTNRQHNQHRQFPGDIRRRYFHCKFKEEARWTLSAWSRQSSTQDHVDRFKGDSKSEATDGSRRTVHYHKGSFVKIVCIIRVLSWVKLVLVTDGIPCAVRMLIDGLLHIVSTIHHRVHIFHVFLCWLRVSLAPSTLSLSYESRGLNHYK